MVRFVILLFVLLLPFRVDAVPVEPVKALEHLRQGFAALQDFTAEIVQEKQLMILKKKLVSTGTVRFRKPDLFFMELNPPHASRMLLRDTVIELYLPQDKTRQQIVLPTDQGLKHLLALLARPVTTMPEGVTVQAERTAGNLTVRFILNKQGQLRAFAITNDGDGRPRTLVIEERNGNRTSITFKRLHANVGLTEKDFRID